MRPKGSGKKGKEKHSQAALEYYAKERELAEQMGLKWRERGPRNADGGSDDASFRGQSWREGSKRFANRGGRKRVYHAEYHRSLRLGFSEEASRQRATDAQDIIDAQDQGREQQNQQQQ